MALADALQGFGAGVQGRLPEFQAQQRASRTEMTDRRKLTALEDAFAVQQQLQAGDIGSARARLQSRLEAVGQLGGDPTHTANTLRKLDAGDIAGALRDVSIVVDFARSQPGGATAASRTFDQFAQGLSPADRAAARRIQLGLDPRAVGSANITTATTEGLTGDVAESRGQIAGAEAGATETAKLRSQLKLKPEVEKAVKLAIAEATAIATVNEENRSNERALAVYNTGIGGLANALGETTTGPVIGLMPAITANQQIADGAVAAMAPVLKQMFRAAGEGIFTDRDQDLLLKMVPTRRDHPETRAAKLQNIDAIVRAKLEPRGEAPQAAPAASGTTFVFDPETGDLVQGQ